MSSGAAGATARSVCSCLSQGCAWRVRELHLYQGGTTSSSAEPPFWRVASASREPLVLRNCRAYSLLLTLRRFDLAARS